MMAGGIRGLVIFLVYVLIGVEKMERDVLQCFTLDFLKFQENPLVTPQKSNIDHRSTKKIAMFKGSYLFEGPSFWVSIR